MPLDLALFSFFFKVFGTDKIGLSNGWYLMTGRTVCGLVGLTMNSHIIV